MATMDARINRIYGMNISSVLHLKKKNTDMNNYII